MGLRRDLEIGVISSVIATIVFLYLLQPLLRLFGFLLFTYGSSIFHVYINRLFEQAALMTPPVPSLDLEMFLFGFLDAFMIGSAITFISFPKLMRGRDRITKMIRDNPHRTEKLMGRLSWFMLILTVTLTFLTTLTLYSTYFQEQVISSFEQHLTAVAPYVSEQQIRLFKSQWTQMRSERDYEAIYSELDKIAEANHITLPPNYVFSFNTL